MPAAANSSKMTLQPFLIPKISSRKLPPLGPPTFCNQYDIDGGQDKSVLPQSLFLHLKSGNAARMK